MFNFGNSNDMFMEQWQKMVSEWFEKVMQNPDFLKNVGKSMDNVLTSKAFIDDMQQKMMKSMNIPSADVMSRIAQYVIQQEAKILELEDLIHDQNQEIAEIKQLLLDMNKTPKKSTKRSSSTTDKKATAKKQTVKKTTSKTTPKKKSVSKSKK